ncbi:DUF6445 family protein [uncultured Paraglaciecola sp.]|uniref:DUF6445 family protein n=1 Tax=uncultured Paraglaciecola sp. TaxID=1765024 RepID=UPI0030D89BED|tara:strand:- start:6336 stop:7046 length:711 start_codon:yes stop_codon:yes gene_type:complete
MLSPFAKNPNSTVNIMLVGNEKTPVIVIDDMLLTPQAVETDACANTDFSPAENGFYPGTRSALPREYIIEVVRACYQKIAEVYAIPLALQLKPQAGYYSLVNTPGASLSVLQRIPHYDAVDPYYFALLHYINTDQHGGTGFFRDNASGFERIGQDTEEIYLQSAEHFINHIQAPAAEYITRSTKQFTLYSTVEYKPNRLVIYPGNLLHSGLIDERRDVNIHPKNGRLTANIFINFS